MNYSVDWMDPALQALASIWTNALDRQAVVRAQDTIDRLLARNPLENTTHVSEGLYAIEVYPLRAQFELSEANRVVTVVSLGQLP